jgi:threonine synthase
MQFHSTKSALPLVSFRDAVLHCLPPDGGLYVPDMEVDLRQLIINMDEKTGFNELVAAVAPTLFEGEFDPVSMPGLAKNAFDFEPELIRLDEDFSLLNLHKGPTGSVKDYGIAFLSAVLDELKDNTLILSTARGGSGASMAYAFGRRKDIRLVLLYPSGPIHGLDPASYVSNGGNIIPIQLKGTFDDCQRLIVETLLDREFTSRCSLTSANTINIGSLLPQIFYYLYAFIKLKEHLPGDLVFSIPSGNFGNFIAGLYAWKFGMPVNGFIAEMNANNALGDFIRGAPFVPRPVINTNSPAMDIGVPSNHERLAAFSGEAPVVMRNMVHSAQISDNETLMTMEKALKKYGIYIDPHTAVAMAAAFKINESRGWKGSTHTVILATGHPAREKNLVKIGTGRLIKTPDYLLPLWKKSDPIAVIPPSFAAFEGAITSCF